jgi:methionyl-tRNA formyltransferase
MGTSEFAVPSLESIAKTHDVVAVYSQPPKPSGRGMKVKPSAVHTRADSLGLVIETPTRLDAEITTKLEVLAPDFIIVVAYGLILPKSVLELPKKAAINGHASLLPRWRGAAPIHRAIAAGDKETGTTAMLMVKDLDSGPVLCQRNEVIRDDDTTASLHDRLALLTADVLIHAVADFGNLLPIPQDEAAVTWAEKITSAEAEIDFNLPASMIERRIRAFAPSPGAWFSYPREDGKSQRVKVLVAKETADEGAPGQVLDRKSGDGPIIAAGEGGLALLRIQPEGKSVMDGPAFLNGNRLPPQITRAEQG